MATLSSLLDWATYQDRVVSYLGLGALSSAEQERFQAWWDAARDLADLIVNRSDFETVPAPVELAMLDSMKAAYEVWQREGDIRGVTVGGVAIQYGRAQQDVQRAIRYTLFRSLGPWRRYQWSTDDS